VEVEQVDQVQQQEMEIQDPLQYFQQLHQQVEVEELVQLLNQADLEVVEDNQQIKEQEIVHQQVHHKEILEDRELQEWVEVEEELLLLEEVQFQIQVQG
jgi:hypothetical protein